MGKLNYGAPPTGVEIDDRTLAHLQVVIVAKLRRNESLAFTWEHSVTGRDSHSTIWLHPAIAVEFQFYGTRHPALNAVWIDELMRTANSPAGLRVVPEAG
jgi:hypothetical protein